MGFMTLQLEAELSWQTLRGIASWHFHSTGKKEIFPLHQLLKKFMINLYSARQYSNEDLTTGPRLLLTKDIVQLKDDTFCKYVKFVTDIDNLNSEIFSRHNPMENGQTQAGRNVLKGKWKACFTTFKVQACSRLTIKVVWLLPKSQFQAVLSHCHKKKIILEKSFYWFCKDIFIICIYDTYYPFKLNTSLEI